MLQPPADQPLSTGAITLLVVAVLAIGLPLLLQQRSSAERLRRRIETLRAAIERNLAACDQALHGMRAYAQRFSAADPPPFDGIALRIHNLLDTTQQAYDQQRAGAMALLVPTDLPPTGLRSAALRDTMRRATTLLAESTRLANRSSELDRLTTELRATPRRLAERREIVLARYRRALQAADDLLARGVELDARHPAVATLMEASPALDTLPTELPLDNPADLAAHKPRLSAMWQALDELDQRLHEACATLEAWRADDRAAATALAGAQLTLDRVGELQRELATARPYPVAWGASAVALNTLVAQAEQLSAPTARRPAALATTLIAARQLDERAARLFRVTLEVEQLRRDWLAFLDGEGRLLTIPRGWIRRAESLQQRSAQLPRDDRAPSVDLVAEAERLAAEQERLVPPELDTPIPEDDFATRMVPMRQLLNERAAFQRELDRRSEALARLKVLEPAYRDELRTLIIQNNGTFEELGRTMHELEHRPSRPVVWQRSRAEYQRLLERHDQAAYGRDDLPLDKLAADVATERAVAEGLATLITRVRLIRELRDYYARLEAEEGDLGRRPPIWRDRAANLQQQAARYTDQSWPPALGVAQLAEDGDRLAGRFQDSRHLWALDRLAEDELPEQIQRLDTLIHDYKVLKARMDRLEALLRQLSATPANH